MQGRARDATHDTFRVVEIWFPKRYISVEKYLRLFWFFSYLELLFFFINTVIKKK